MYTYTHFIKENAAPMGAKKIIVCDGNGKEICNISLGRLQQPIQKKNYSFLALSDIHLTYDTANADFQRALTYAENNCDFTCIAGDLTSTGSITEGTTNEMVIYKNIVDSYAKTKPVYAISGNHETSYGVYVTSERIQPYTGNGLYYSFTKGNDVFIMLGYYGAYDSTKGWRSDEFVSVAELQWFYNTLEANRNKRCFVFQHVLPHNHGTGNANALYKSALIFDEKQGIGKLFIDLLKHYKNTIFFHGHSHIRFWLQELDKKANYSSVDGYRSIHIPSLSVPRDLSSDGSTLETIYAESEGYVVDVYDDYIILNGRDFIDNDADGHILPIATYKIDTTLVNIAANTFTDSTGTIVT